MPFYFVGEYMEALNLVAQLEEATAKRDVVLIKATDFERPK